MSSDWAIAIAGFVVTITLFLLSLGIKALWSIAKTFRELITRTECNAEMGKHCQEINALRAGFEENKSAIRQIILALKQLHGVDISYRK